MKLFSQYDRFYLEQDIIKLWETNEMIDELIRRHLDSPEGPLSDDEFANKLDGIKHCNDLKIQRLWDGFEVMIKKGLFVKTGQAVEVDDVNIDININKRKSKGNKK